MGGGFFSLTLNLNLIPSLNPKEHPGYLVRPPGSKIKIRNKIRNKIKNKMMNCASFQTVSAGADELDRVGEVEVAG